CGMSEEDSHPPTYVRVKFLGEGYQCAKKVPLRGTFKDVKVRSLEELQNEVEQWLGTSGGWMLGTAANWELKEEALQRPSSSRCPLVVHVWNSQKMLLDELAALGAKIRSFESEDGREANNQTLAKVDKQVQQLDEHVVRLKEEFYETLGGALTRDATHKAQAGSMRRQLRCFSMAQATCWWLFFLSLMSTAALATSGVACYQAIQVQKNMTDYSVLSKKVRRIDKDKTMTDDELRQDIIVNRQRIARLRSDLVKLQANQNKSDRNISEVSSSLSELAKNLTSTASVDRHRAQETLHEAVAKVMKVIGQVNESLTNASEGEKHQEKHLGQVVQQEQKTLKNLTLKLAAGEEDAKKVEVQQKKLSSSVSALKIRLAGERQKDATFSERIDKVEDRIDAMNTTAGIREAQKKQVRVQKELQRKQLQEMEQKTQAAWRKNMSALSVHLNSAGYLAEDGMNVQQGTWSVMINTVADESQP
ncbi:unnamed protein product, partial [Effrenium voratum]